MSLAEQLLQWINARRRQGSTQTLVRSFQGTVLFHRALKVEGAVSKIATPSMQPFGSTGPLAVDLYLVAVAVEELLGELADLRRAAEENRRQVEKLQHENHVQSTYNADLNAKNELLRRQVEELLQVREDREPDECIHLD